MPPLPILQGVHYARVEGTFNNLPSTNIFAFQVVPPGLDVTTDTADAVEVCTQIADAWPAFANSVFPTQYQASQVTCYPLGHPLVPAQSRVIAGGGGETSNLTAAQAAWLMKHTVTRRGKGSQSRSFFSPVGIASTNASGTELIASEVAKFQNAWELFMPIVLNQLNLYRGQWIYGQVSKKGAGNFFPITASNVEPALASQRRRVRRA